MVSYVLASLLIAAQPQVQVQTFSGQAPTGSLVELSAEKVVVETAAGTSTFQVDDLLHIALPNPPVPAADTFEVMLVDGSRIVSKSYTVAGNKVKLVPSLGGELELAQSDVARVRFQPLNEALDPQWERVLALDPATDMLVVRNDDSLDYLEGVLGEISDRVSFDPGDGLVRVKRERVFGLLYFHKAGRKFAPPLCLAVDTGGSRFQVASFSLADTQIKLVTATGLEVVRPLEKISRLDFSQGKVQYLSDLKPLAMEMIPAIFVKGLIFEQTTPPRLDRSLDGGPLSLDDRKFTKGLAVKSYTRIAYRLGGEFRRFQAVIGIDDSVGAQGHVQVTIRGDKQVLFAGELAGGDKPRGKPLDLDVSGLQRLEITVDYGKQLDISDHVDFGDARIIK